jgi:archaetidylinositol phosphate synthase
MTHPATAGPRFREARRELSGLTAPLERRALLWLAARTPLAVHSDHLTLLGLGAMALCGGLYAVDGALVLNWLGDSLDGTLARHRRHERPRFGFYADHLADAFGALFVLGGLALSGLMSPLVAAGFLIAYYLLAIESYLATYALGRFKISWGPVGGTELRIGLALANVAALLWPTVPVSGGPVRLFDLLAAPAAIFLVALAVAAGVRGTRELLREEGSARHPRARALRA